MERILIIEVNWIGDVLFTTPAIRAIRERYPESFIAALAVPRCIEMMKDNPNIDEIIAFEEKGRHRGVFGRLSLIYELRKRRFDTAISFHRSMSRMLLAALAGIPRRIGYYTKKRSWLLTEAVTNPDAQMHRVEYFLNIVRAVGMHTANKNYELFIPKPSLVKADEILRQAGLGADEEYLVVNPGGNWPPKRWPSQRYAQLCENLKRTHKERVVITGAEKDIPLADEIIRTSKSSAASICGRTTLKELAAVMRKASLVVSNDSGPMHIAVSQRTPVVALFGPTHPGVTGPYGDGDYIVLQKWDKCDIPCYDLSCNHYRCMEAISVEDVLGAVKGLKDKKSKDKG